MRLRFKAKNCQVDYLHSKKIELILQTLYLINAFCLLLFSSLHTTNNLRIYTMALTKVNVALAGLIEETSLSTVEKLIAFLGEKIEIDDDMKQYFDEFKASIKNEAKVDLKKASKKDAGEKKEKRTRPPSPYNMYIRDKMAEFKAAGHTGNLMKMAIEAWNKDKEAKTTDDEKATTTDDEKVVEPTKGKKGKK